MDLINKDELINTIADLSSDSISNRRQKCIEALEQLNRVHIYTCDQCKMFEPIEEVLDVGHCKIHGFQFPPDFFCAQYKSREDV